MTAFLQLVYRMPAKPTAGRVAVWRNLKKAGAVYLQDSVCVVPDTDALRAELEPVLARIDECEGSYHLLPLVDLPDDEHAKLVQLFVDQATKHYAEIVEDCEVNFVKEIEFEHFRQNYTYEEAEEIRMEFEKICTWFEPGAGAGLVRRAERRRGPRLVATVRVVARGVRGEGLRAPRRRRGRRGARAPARAAEHRGREGVSVTCRRRGTRKELS